MRSQFCKLARPGTKIPMPGSGGRLFSERGETVDVEAPFWRRLIDDRDIVIAREPMAAQAAEPDTKPKRKG